MPMKRLFILTCHQTTRSCKEGTFENHSMRKALPNSDAGSNCWWEKTTTFANFEKEDFTQIRSVFGGRYSQGPGKRMDDGGADVEVAENSMESYAWSLLKSTVNACRWCIQRACHWFCAGSALQDESWACHSGRNDISVPTNGRIH